jgi:RNA polymerase sigma-70 factor (ECF subfamily)
VLSVPGVFVRPVELNGDAGALLLDAQERVVGACALQVAGGQVTGIAGIVNPDKLAHLGPTANLGSLLRG